MLVYIEKRITQGSKFEQVDESKIPKPLSWAISTFSKNTQLRKQCTYFRGKRHNKNKIKQNKSKITSKKNAMHLTITQNLVLGL